MTRTSTWIGWLPPTRSNVPLCSTRRIFVCVAGVMSPISSRKIVPPLHCSNLPMRWHGRAGERASFVAEQFAFQQLLGNRGAVDGEERLLAAVAVMINRAGDEFLAGAAFAGDERGGVGARRPGR